MQKINKPMKLFYKFKNINDYALSSLEKKYFYFSTPEQLNDPEDCRSPISYDSSNKNILNWIKHVKSWFKRIDREKGISKKFEFDTVDKVRKSLESDGFVKKMLESSQIKVENCFHLLSLTDDWNDIFMWDAKDYCSSFSGICIAYKAYQLQYPEFDSYFIKIDKTKTEERYPYFCQYNNDKYFVLKKVEYDNDRKHFYKPFEEKYDKDSCVVYDTKSENLKNLEYNFFHKTPKWAKENEYRGFYTTVGNPDYKIDDSKIFYTDDVLDSITLGFNISQNQIDTIKDLIKQNYSNFENIKFYILRKNSNENFVREEIQRG